MDGEVLVTMPLQIPSALLKAVRSDPLTSVEDKDEMNTRIGWLLCAWDVMVEARRSQILGAPPILMQDENSGRDGRRYNEWHASRPDARLNAREAAEALRSPPAMQAQKE